MLFLFCWQFSYSAFPDSILADSLMCREILGICIRESESSLVNLGVVCGNNILYLAAFWITRLVKLIQYFTLGQKCLLCKSLVSDYSFYMFPWTKLYHQGSGGVTIKKTNQALIIGIYDEPLTPGQCNMIVERLGDYLIDQGL